MSDGSVKHHSRNVRTVPSGDDVRFCTDTVIDTALALRSNRPPVPYPPGSDANGVRVISRGDLLVYPDSTAPEIIRSSEPGEMLPVLRPRPLPPSGSQTAVLQDGDVAYVASDNVKIIHANNHAAKRD